MNEVTTRLLLSFEFRPFFILFVLTLGILYTIGWSRLRTKSRSGQLAPGWKLTAYWVALVTILVALLSFIDKWSGWLFYMHMIQHLMLTMIAGPLIMLADPLPMILWGLPRPLRVRVGFFINRIVHQRSPWRRMLRACTTPAASYVIMLVLLWGWHDPRLYNWALNNQLVHDLEHISFLLSSLIFWWHVTGAGPRIHPMMSRGARIGYIFAGIPSTFLLGVYLSFSDRVIYTYYETLPRIDHPLFLSPLNDQILGGIIMWVPGNMMYLVAGLFLAGRWMQEEEAKSRAEKYKWMAEQQAKASAVQGSD